MPCVLLLTCLARWACAGRAQPEPLSENERKVLSCIGPQPLGIEELCVRSGLPTAVLLGTLMKLELSGRVLCMPGKRYVIK